MAVARSTGRSELVNRALAIAPPGGGWVARLRARVLTRIVNRTLKSKPSGLLDRAATALIVKVSGRPTDDPELDHEAWSSSD